MNKVVIKAIRKAIFSALCAARFTVLSLSTLGLVHAASDGFLEPEVAFQMSAKAIDSQTVEVQFVVAPGYYLYKNKFGFKAKANAESAGVDPQASVVIGEASFPPAIAKIDPQFGQTDVYRDTLLLPVAIVSGAKAGEPFTISVKAQGCADAGLCYPPFTREARIVPSSLVASTKVTSLSAPSAMPSISVPSIAARSTVAPMDESSRVGALLASRNLPLILVSFFGFGLLLSLTPCVFPMIPILSGIIVGSGSAMNRKRAFFLSLAYVLGMATTYAAAGVAAGLSGTLLSAALQNAWVLGGFALVFVALSLSMFGFYELQLPNSLQTRLNDSANKQGGSAIGVAVMGALSALIVGPCVAAPLAGALLYIAQSGDALLGGLGLFVMALGMGVPLLLIGTVAGSLLPRAGAWMEGVKKAFGVMLLGVALWLAQPVLPELVVMLGWAALLLFSGVYLRALDPLPTTASGANRFWKGTGVILAIAGGAMLVGALAGSRDPLQPLALLRGGASLNSATNATKPVTFERIRSVAELDNRLSKASRPVMLDFYADWCVSCKEMDHLTFADPSVRKRLDHLELLQVDVTANSADDKALLKRFGLFGPPGIVFFDAQSAKQGAEPKEIQRVIGFQKSALFIQSLDMALQSQSQSQPHPKAQAASINSK